MLVLTLHLIEVLHCVRYLSIFRGSFGWKVLELQLARYMNIGTIYQEIFALLNFCENGDFNNFVNNIFANDTRGQHKRCGMAIFCEI